MEVSSWEGDTFSRKSMHLLGSGMSFGSWHLCQMLLYNSHSNSYPTPTKHGAFLGKCALPLAWFHLLKQASSLHSMRSVEPLLLLLCNCEVFYWMNKSFGGKNSVTIFMCVDPSCWIYEVIYVFSYTCILFKWINYWP